MIKAEAASSNVGDKDAEIGRLLMELKLIDDDKAELQRTAAAQVQDPQLKFECRSRFVGIVGMGEGCMIEDKSKTNEVGWWRRRHRWLWWLRRRRWK